MSHEQEQIVDRLHGALVDEIRSRRPQYLHEPFTVAEIYQDLVPYRSHRDRIGASMNGDYEHALLSMLAGWGGYLLLESETARRRLADELESSNPNTGVIREYAALDVRLNPARISPEPGPPSRPHGDLLALDDVPGGATAASMPSRAETPPAEAAASGEAPSGAALSEAVPTSAGADAAESCRWCRESLPRKASLRFCPFCGMDVNVVPCQSCGEELEPSWRFCIACGTHVVTED